MTTAVHAAKYPYQQETRLSPIQQSSLSISLNWAVVCSTRPRVVIGCPRSSCTWNEMRRQYSNTLDLWTIAHRDGLGIGCPCAGTSQPHRGNIAKVTHTRPNPTACLLSATADPRRRLTDQTRYSYNLLGSCCPVRMAPVGFSRSRARGWEVARVGSVEEA